MCRFLQRGQWFLYRGTAISMNPPEPREPYATTIRLASATKVQERLQRARRIPGWKTSFESQDGRQNDFLQRLPRGVGRVCLLRPEPAVPAFLPGGPLTLLVSEQPAARICQLSRPSKHTAGRE